MVIKIEHMILGGKVFIYRYFGLGVGDVFPDIDFWVNYCNPSSSVCIINIEVRICGCTICIFI